jgi:chromosome segregation ATPase
MKQANDLHEENLLLIQTTANQFWSEYNELSIFLDNISKQLLEIHPCSTSYEYIEHEQEKYNQLITDFLNKQIKYQEFLQQYSLQLLTLISNNQQETEDIQCCIHELEQKWNRIQTDLNTCQNQLSEAMIKSAEFNAKLESVSTWFDETSSLTTTIEDDNNNQFEHIRTVKENLDKKYMDIVNLKQDYTDIEQQNEYIMEEKTNLIQEQFEEIDLKWTQLNDKIQEQ